MIMKHLFALVFALSSFIFASCKTTSPTTPPDTSKGTPTAVGTPVGAPSSATIDAAGGSLLSPDGRVEVIIPPNALSTATALSIQPITNETPLGAGLGFDLLPNGQKFNTPVTVRFHYASNDLAGSDVKALRIATQTTDRIWHRFASYNLDTIKKEISVTTTHFSPYNMYNDLRVIPYFDKIAVSEEVLVAVVFVTEGTEADATGYPLSPYVLYSTPSQIRWSVNGTPNGSPQNGLVSPTTGVSSATYTAPAKTGGMTSNPVAVTAEVTTPASGTMILISNVTVTPNGANGTITMSIEVSGFRTHTEGERVQTKTENGSGSLTYNLSGGEVTESSGARDVSWNDAAFGGSSIQTSEYMQSYPVICNSGKITHVDRTVTKAEFSSSAAGPQVTGVGLSVDADGSYQLVIGPSTNPAASSNSVKSTFDCFPVADETTKGTTIIPFVHYFLSYVGGKTILGGKIDPSKPNKVTGTYHGTDIVMLFDITPTPITMPFEYTISWDIDLGN